MANTLKDLSDGDINRFALLEFHNALTFLKTIDNQYDNRFAQPGAKNDGTILIRDPNEYIIRTGKILAVQDAKEQTQTFTVATQKGVDLPSFSSLEQTMQVDDFRRRFLRPAMLRLAAEIESTIITDMYKAVFNQTGTPVTTPASLSAIRDAGARLSQELAPRGDRSLILEALAMAATTNSMQAFFHQGKAIQKSFIDGFIGHAVGFDWLESEMVPTHTNGTRTDTTPVMDTSTITTGDTTLTTTGYAGTLKKGDIFTVGTTSAGIMSVNREVKTRQAHLQQFVVTADKTLDSTDVIAVSPKLVTSGARQNVEIVAAGAGQALLNETGGGSGAASLITSQNLAYHRMAFTFVTTDLHIEPGERMTREVMEGISMRIWHGADIINDEFVTRIDILFGSLAQRPEWAVRVRG